MRDSKRAYWLYRDRCGIGCVSWENCLKFVKGNLFYSFVFMHKLPHVRFHCGNVLHAHKIVSGPKLFCKTKKGHLHKKEIDQVHKMHLN